jgi:class 3 adenylate cyclase
MSETIHPPAGARILVAEDEDSIRNNILRLLKIEGYDPVGASDGKQALGLVQSQHFDLVLTDINMPILGGFDLLRAIRNRPPLTTIPVVILTALDDRASYRRGMSLGANDYLSKPFTRAELLEAVQAQLKQRHSAEEMIDKRIEQAVEAQEQRLSQLFSQSMAGRSSDKWAMFEHQDAISDESRNASVLFSDIRGFTTLAERLTAADVAEMLAAYYARASQPILHNGGQCIKFIGDGVMAVFTDAPSGNPLPHARRALSCALGMVLAAQEFQQWLSQRFKEITLPPFAIGVGVHSGDVMFCKIGTLHTSEITVIGDTVNIASRLEGQSKLLGWSVVSSQDCAIAAGEGVQLGRQTIVVVKGREAPVHINEVMGITANLQDRIHGMASLAERADDIRKALETNASVTARAVKDALTTSMLQLKALESGRAPDAPEVHVKGYAIHRRIGTGGMSEVFLGSHPRFGQEVVLKLVNTHQRGQPDLLQRFVNECALLSRIHHPNVVRIFEQGFSDDFAYLSMEFFASGDLSQRLKSGKFAPQQAVQWLGQAAEALAVIHAMGIVHRDVKPQNFMLRADSSLALTDFGIAKMILTSTNTGDMGYTRHGEIVGTPFYLSPEQIKGEAISAASDTYALGAIAYELFAGRKPYTAESLEALLGQHLYAAVPSLPAQWSHLQGWLDKAMAKDPKARFPSARQMHDELQAAGLP